MSLVQLERDGAVFVLRMAAGENRLNGAMVAALNEALDDVEASQGEAALVTTGQGRFYSTGLDLEWLAQVDREEVQPFLVALHGLFGRLLAFPVAAVAAINGHAFAAGAMLAFAQDFRVMRTGRGFVCLPEVDLATGGPLTPGMYALLGAKLTPAALHEALVTGRRYPAEEALARSLLHEALPENEVLPRAVEIARGLAAKHRPTLAALKRGLYARALETLERPATGVEIE